MQYRFTINGRLHGLNDYLSAERVSFRGKNGKFTTKGNTLKHETQNKIISYIRRDLGGLVIKSPVRIHYQFFEPNKKRDLDNIWAFTSKCTQDALVQAGVLSNDGWENICQISAEFHVDKENPHINVFLIEVEKGE